MIDAAQLLADLKRLLPSLEADIRDFAEKVEPERMVALEAAHAEALAAERTAQSFIDYRDAQITQAAVAWVLSAVFVRFLEDNKLLPPQLGGPVGEALQQAKGQLEVFFREDPTRNDRDYLLRVFEQLKDYPVMKALLDQAHNPLWQLPLSADGAKALLGFFQGIDNAGLLRHDFSDSVWDTRFLGDLYQDLSESVRKRYALLQTPEFVEDFILDYTLDKALDAYALSDIRLIDPTCGSGHFLLGAFARLFAQWQAREPGTGRRLLAERALQAVHGVDINPYAVAVARFRLLVAAMHAADCHSIASAPAFPFHLAVGDSLLHGKRHESQGQGIQTDMHDDPIGHVFATEDSAALNKILGQQYHAVVGNPPYIVVRDKALNNAYRHKYPSCHRQYSLGVPFTERFFDLTLPTDGNRPAGFVGMITANSFMKREFGKKLIQEFFPRKDLTHVIDTSGAYIPGHGTPTVILFGRNRGPRVDSLRAVLGIRGEPGIPADPAQGLVWRSIVELLEKPDSENAYVSVLDQPRELYGKHPWSVGGGGATELKALVEASSESMLKALASSIGFVCITKQDDVFVQEKNVLVRSGVLEEERRPFGIGEEVRDWEHVSSLQVLFPYEDNIETRHPNQFETALKFMWPYQTDLYARKVFGGQTYRQARKPWYEFGQIPVERFKIPLSITFAFVATHNHFVLDRGGKVFKQTAPVIKLPAGASEADHLALLGLLNSSVACFWGRQTLFQKGGFADGKWQERQEWDGTKLKTFPVITDGSSALLETSTAMDKLAQQLSEQSPERALATAKFPPAQALAEAAEQAAALEQQMIAQQEELDWLNYRLYGLIDDDLCSSMPPPLALGQRTFEIALARQMAAGESQTTWFSRHGSSPITELPGHWPADYAALVERRLQAMSDNRWIALVEQPEYKRRWNTEPWAKRQMRALREWLLDHLESHCHEPTLQTAAQLAARVRHGERFQQVAALYCDEADFDAQQLVVELLAADQVPAMAAARYKPKGVEKYRAWQRTWDLQRAEDAIDARCALPEADAQHLSDSAAKALKAAEVGDIPLPPKYGRGDYLRGEYWPLRGKLDVPKERFFSLPGAERDGDSTQVFGWAGLDHLQRATAIATWQLERREQDGWQGEQLLPMLVALEELTPWLLQWHNELDPEFGERMGDYYRSFLHEQLRELELSAEMLLAWQPPAKPKVKRRAKK